MKKFEAPLMDVQKIDQQEIITASEACFESFDCVSCYCLIVICDDYSCTGHKCKVHMT